MDVFFFKIITFTLLFIFAVIFGTLPIFLRRLAHVRVRKCANTVLLILLYSQGLAGGVLLGGGTLHLIPDAFDNLRTALANLGAPQWAVDFPSALAIAFSTFILIFSCENCVGLCVAQRRARRDLLSVNGDEDETTPLLGAPPDVESGDIDSDDQIVSSSEGENAGFEEEDGGSLMDMSDDDSHAIHDDHDDDGHSHFMIAPVLQRGTLCQKIISAVFLWISLSLHSFFVGLALGSTTDLSSFWLLLFAIITHKLVAAYALGIELEKSIKPVWLYLLFTYGFAASTPSGIGVGLIFGLIQNKDVFQLVSNIFIAMSAGAFIHVSLFEFLYDFVKDNKKWQGFAIYILLFAAEFVIMAGLSVAV